MGNAESSPEEVPVVECGDDVFREDADAGFAPTDHALDSAAGVAANLAALNLPLEAVGEASGGDKTFTAAAVERRMSDYKLESKVLGEGGFGKVKLATCTKTGHQVAVKIIKRNKLNERAEVLLKREVKHHERLRHPNIVRLYTWIKTPARYFLVMECCPEGDLLQYLNARRRLASAEARHFFRHLLLGLRFCHGLGIFHRDLKLENLMLAADPSAPPTAAGWERRVVKIADFGLSDLTPVGLSTTCCGSPLYAAPELMSGGSREGYDASRSDMWSCGVVLYALLASHLPFDADDIQALIRLICSGVPSSPLPKERGAPAAELTASLMSVDPAARPTAAAALEHEWVATPEAPPPAVAAKSMGALPVREEEEEAEEAPPESRRGVSESSAFFKTMLARERGGGAEGSEAAPAPASTSPIPEAEAEGAGGARQPGARITKAEIEAIRAEAAKPS